MKSTFADLRTSQPELSGETLGTIRSRLRDDRLLVSCGDARLTCRRAHSCLLEPEIGDRVLISCVDPQHPYVLAILERPYASAARIHIDGDLTFESNGTVRFHAAQGIHLHGENEVKVHGNHLELNVDEAELIVKKTSLHCVELQGWIGALRLIGKTLETVVERVVQISKASFRTVETVDHVRSAHLDYAASASVRLHGKHALLTAERLSKIDAQHIHLG